MAAKIRVLVVDDSSVVRDLLAKSLNAPEHGLEVVALAVHGQDALAKLKTTSVDVVITDMDMPVMNGLEFIRVAMAAHAVPIIVLSSWAHNDKAITLQALEAGAADFVPKPSALSPQGFQETLSRLAVKIKAVARLKKSAISEIAFKKPFDEQHEAQIAQRNAVVPYSATAPNYQEKTSQLIIGIGEIAVSNEYGKIIKTFALGSCVAVSLFSPTADIVGMAHVALASSATSPEKAKELPGYFADTALETLLHEMYKKGYAKPVAHLLAKITGGAQTGTDTGNYFKIGEKNVAAVKTLLEKLNISCAAEDTGQSYSRTVFVQVGSKAVHISSPERASWHI